MKAPALAKLEDGRVYVPIRVLNESNESGHWRKKAARVKKVRSAAALHLRWFLGKRVGPVPERVILTRIGPREMDDDGVVSSLKAVRDGVADWLGINDKLKIWSYEQRRGGVREYAITIEIVESEVAWSSQRSTRCNSSGFCPGTCGVGDEKQGGES